MTSQIHCIAFILDGNRRWAQEKGLPSLLGHQAGFEALEKTIRAVAERGIPHMAAYVFSTENWNRTQEEVGYLMDLFRKAAKTKINELIKEGVAVRFVGKFSMLPEDLQQTIKEVEASNPENPKITVWLCVSYGSRAEIAAAAKAATESEGEISEANLEKHLWSAGMPEPDILVRTSGEQRLSNFLLWQLAYSEFFFLKPHWPDFDEKMLDEVLEEYAARERRRGR